MTVAESKKNAGDVKSELLLVPLLTWQHNTAFSSFQPSGQQKTERKILMSIIAVATREEMSAARLPLAYRDSCAHLLIPLNRCRYEEYYLPWKCEVGRGR
jgi:hypothetical protein